MDRHMGVATVSHRAATVSVRRTVTAMEGTLRDIADHERAQIAGIIALVGLVLLGACIMYGG
jgi:hypothetical protein